jgi:hypothetical protein
VPQARPLSPAETVPFSTGQTQKPEEEQGYQWGNWLSNPLNELKFLGKAAKEAVVDPVVEAVDSVQALDEGYRQVYRGTKGSSVYRAPDGTLTGNTPSQVEAQQGSVRAVTQPLQYLGQPGQAARQSIVDASAGVIGATKEEDLVDNPDARRAQGVGQFATETAVATLLTGGLSTFAAPARAMLPGWMSGALGRIPAKGLVKWGAAGATEEVISGLLQDPLANPGFVFQLDENDTVWSAALKNAPSNAIGGLVLGGAIEGTGRVIGAGINSVVPNLARRQRSVNAIKEVEEARNWTEENGIQEKTPDGKYEFTPEEYGPQEAPEQGPQEPPVAEGNILDNYEQRRAEVVGDAEPVDPEAPEVSTVVRGLDQLDDAQLQRLDQAETLVEELDAELENSTVEFVDRPQQLVAAPADRLADTTIPYMDQIAAINNDDLLSMADPRNSQQLFQRVSEITGKELEDFTRKDVIAGIESLANKDNIQFLPNRIDPQSGGLADVNEIKVDPERFQYKSNVNDQGQQKGNSLEGVDKWSTDFEGVVDVWEDPTDGEIYVVNGHNRLAKAKEMGVGSIRVNFIPARTAEQARAFGAAANIASGSGTAFDAAKYFRDSGLDNAQALEAAGIPMAGERSLGAQGLALSKLPPGVFQDAVDGKLPLSTAVKIGSSGLSPENMIRVASITQDMGPMAALEVIDMAKTAPRVESGEMTLFGAEVMDTIKIKAELAARLRSEMTSAKNTFKGAAKDRNAKRLQQANTNVDQAAATEQAGYAEQLLGTFDAEKYAEGTEIGRLLNEGTEDIASGAKPAAVARRLMAELQDQPLAPQPKAKPEPEVEASPEQQWEALSTEEAMLKREQAEKKLLSQRKIDNRKKVISDADDAFANEGEVDLKKVERAQKQLDDHAEADAYIAWYDQRNDLPLTPDQRNDIKKNLIKKARDNGEIRPDATPTPTLDNPAQQLEELVFQPINAMREEIRLADQYARQDAVEADAQARAKREANGYYGQDIDKKLDNGLLEDFPEDTPDYPEPEGEPSYQLPADVAKSKPRYGLGVVQFGSDLDRAAYIIRSKSKKSKGEDRIIASLEEQGLDVAAVRKHGEKVKKAISDQVLDMTGSRRAPQSSMEIAVPAQQFGDSFTTSSVAGDAFRSRIDPENYVSPEFAREAATAITDIVDRVAGGKGLRVKINEKPGPEMVLPLEHGGDGKTKTFELGSYNWSNDVMTVHDFLRRDADELIGTAYHESWHRLQARFLTKGEMRMLSKLRNKKRVGEMAGFDAMASDKASIEMQAIAFEQFAAAKELAPEITAQKFLEMQRSRSGRRAMEEFARLEANNIGDEDVLRLAQQNNNKFYAQANALIDSLDAATMKPLAKFFDRLYDLFERVRNFAEGNGFTSVDDLFERAYAGKLAKRREIGLVFDDIGREPFASDWLSDNAMSERLALMESEANLKQAALRQQAIKEGC